MEVPGRVGGAPSGSRRARAGVLVETISKYSHAKSQRQQSVDSQFGYHAFAALREILFFEVSLRWLLERK